MNTSDPRYQKILAVVRCVPAGCVASYGQVAQLAGLPGRARMVGRVLGYAPVEDPVPWHRILRSDGRLGFPENSVTAQKQSQYLREEGVLIKSGRVAMKTYQWQPSLEELFKLNAGD